MNNEVTDNAFDRHDDYLKELYEKRVFGKGNQFTVEAKVTYVNELHLDFHGVDNLKEGVIPSRNRLKDRNLVSKSEILILRISGGFKNAFEGAKNIPMVVLKSKY